MNNLLLFIEIIKLQKGKIGTLTIITIRPVEFFIFKAYIGNLEF